MSEEPVMVARCGDMTALYVADSEALLSEPDALRLIESLIKRMGVQSSIRVAVCAQDQLQAISGENSGEC